MSLDARWHWMLLFQQEHRIHIDRIFTLANLPSSYRSFSFHHPISLSKSVPQEDFTQ
jgi:hypothetical protein